MRLDRDTRISHYKILDGIGKGGMGEVYLAEDLRLGRKVAIKVLPPEFTRDADRVRRFIQEAKAASALNHPSIITVHDIGESDAGRFIVMELVSGRTLRATAAELVTLEAVIGWGSQLARALHVAHAAGITHRDIKPENIMLRDDGYVKVLDFGLASLLPANLNDSAGGITRETAPGQLLGTVGYMSPEQAVGDAVGYPSDIFALGIVLYELATGQHPFKGATLFAVMQAITTHAPAAPTQVNPALPAALDALLLQMLAKHPTQRPTAAGVENALLDIARLRERQGEGPMPVLAPASGTSGRAIPVRHTVGRERERQELRTAFHAARAGRGSLVCVAGEPGIGKTTLVEDFLAELSAGHPCTIARGRCSERLAGTEAYLPLLEALEALLRCETPSAGASGSLAARMRQLAPTWYAQVAPLSGDSGEARRLMADVQAASQDRMKRELANFLHAVVQSQPLVMFFDDLQWADVSTIDVLTFLAGRFDAMRVLIVAAYRSSDMILGKHPFLQIKPDLQARGLCRELELEFLSAADVDEFLSLEFPGHRFPAGFSRLIHTKTEGSPLFVADLLRDLRDRGVIAKASGTWTLAHTLPNIERDLPESVRGMIERKITQLGDEDRQLLTAASVQGYEFDSATLAQALRLDAGAVEERLEQLERVFAFVKLTGEAEFPNHTPTLKYRFVHVLYQNALYNGLRPTRRAALSRDVAQSLEASYGARSASAANELGLLWEAARDYARAADYLLQAARNAARINAHGEAAQLAGRGLAAVGRLPDTPPRAGQELALQLTLGFSLMSVLGWAAGEVGAAFNRAHQLCLQMGEDPRLVAALGGLAIYHQFRAEYSAAQHLCEQISRLAEQSQDPVLQAVASARSAVVHYFQGEFLSAHQQGTRALSLDRQEYHDAYLALANENLGIAMRRDHSLCLWSLGYPDQGRALAYESITLAGQIAHPFSRGGAGFGAALTLSLLRDWPSAQREVANVLRLAEEYALGDLFHHATALNALNLAYQAPTEAAIDRVFQSIALLRTKGVMMAMTWCLARLAEVMWRAGRSSDGLSAASEAVALVERTGERNYEAELWRLRGDLILQAASSDAEAEAEGCYQRSLAIARRQGGKAYELRTATSLARVWQQQGRIDDARQLLAGIYGWFTEGFGTADLQDAASLMRELA
jgi:tetratricopeptide (TPR) repeat protein